MDIRVFALSESGQAIKVLPVELLESLKGVKAKKGVILKLKKGDKLVYSIIYSEGKDKEIIYLTRNGFGARVKISDIRLMGIGMPGVSFVKTNVITGKVAMASLIEEGETRVKIITSMGKKIVMKINLIPILKRGHSHGVSIVKLEKGEYVNNIATIK